MTDENPQESQPGGYDSNPPTGGLPTFEPPPPGSTYPAQPQWSAPVAPVLRWRLRDHLTVAIIVAVVMIVVVGLGVTWIMKDGGVRTAADTTPLRPVAAQQQHQIPASAGANGQDLTKGAVFLDSNDRDMNTVVAFARGADGTLHKIGTYPTGGKGSGSVEDTSSGLVVASTQGTVSPQHDVNDPKFLIVPNLGSGTVTVFKIKPHGLQLASTTITGGIKPVSIAVSHGLVYVLQSGEVTDQFLTSATTDIENCTTGELPTVVGFHIDDNGVLTPIQGSTRLLSGDADSGCTMVGFTPDGKFLFAAERRAGKPDPKTGFQKGDLLSFPVQQDGTLGQPTITTPAANGVYTFVFTKDGRTMLTADQNGDIGNANGGEVESYSVNDGQVTPIESTPVPTERTDSCWVVLTNDETLAFVSSAFGNDLTGGSIASYRVDKGGKMTLLFPEATSDDGHSSVGNHLSLGVLDLALSKDSQYLYALDGLSGGVYGFKVNSNGTLTYVQSLHTFNIAPLNLGGQGGPNGIAAY